MAALFARYKSYLAMTLVFVLVLIGTVITLQRRDPPALVITTPTARAAPTTALIVIDVRGAVEKPDVYKLAEGSRVQEALERAGGVAKNGDTSALNLARKLNDGEQIFVPRIGDATPTLSPSSSPAPTRAASGCLGYKDASAHVNETTCVRGTVTSAEKTGSVFNIYFDDSATSFYAIAFNRTWDNLRGKCIEVSGKIALFRNRAQIVLDKEEQLSFCK
jgi:DNA uptake protein ComE-like DNA-binding protein